MDKIKAIEQAIEIVSDARVAVFGNNPAAWRFLDRVGAYLAAQSIEAFNAEFREL